MLSFVCLAFLSIQSTEAKNYLKLEKFKDTKGWSMVENGKIDPTNPTQFVLKRGNNTLLSNGDKKNLSQYLTTNETWGDQEIHAEFMIPKGSNSGLYVQGRYEIQILDSHGKKNVTPADMGGVYQRWDPAREAQKLDPGFEGTPPLVNAALPHGEWQELKIKFRAPRFDKLGYKISHAHFVEVTLNGTVIQKGVDAKGPTRSARLSGEATEGPLVIQGDHGPILLRKLEILERDYSSMTLAKLPANERFPLDKNNHPQINTVTLGKTAFTNRGCIECHATYTDEGTIKTGPSLYGLFQKEPKEITVFDPVAKKNTKVIADKNYFLSSMGNPTKHLSLQTQATEKGKPYMPLMPPYTNEMIPADEVSAIHNYLLTLNSPQNAGSATVFASATPKEISKDLDPYILEVGDRTMVIRGMVDNNSSARGVHVGQTNGQNFSFDPRSLSVQAIWTGDFLDMRNEVNGRGGKSSTIGLEAELWPAPFTNILRPLLADGVTAYDKPLTNSNTPDTLNRTTSFFDQLKANDGKFLGYTTGKSKKDTPTFHYLIDGNKVNLNFNVNAEGKFLATLTGELKQDLTMTFPADGFSEVNVSGGNLDKNKGTWTLSSLTEPVTWTATPTQPISHLPKNNTSRIQPSSFAWTDEKAKLDILPGYSAQIAEGPRYTDGTSPLFEPTAIDFDKDGTPVIGSRAAGIWKIKDDKWHPYALGTYEVLGLRVIDNGDLVVCQKPEVSIIKDSNNDGIAETFETISADFRFKANYHAYNHGPAVDSKGNIHFTLNLQHATTDDVYTANGQFMGSQGGFRGWNLRVSPDGTFAPYAMGFRSAAGLAFSPDDVLYSSDNQGEFMGTSRINRIEEGKFYGHPSGLIDIENMTVKALQDGKQAEYIAKRETSVVLMPHKFVANSPGNPVWDTTEGKFGPFKGQIFIGDQTLSNIHRVDIETINGIEQGSIMPFASGLPSGPMRLTFSPTGELWAGQTGRGWVSRGGKQSALQKFKWSGKTEQAIHSVNVKRTGLQMNFTLPIPEADRGSYDKAVIDSWHYQDTSKYGSPEMNKRVEELSPPVWNDEGTAVFYAIENFGIDPEREKIPNATSRVFRINLHETAFGKTNTEFLSTAYYTLNTVPEK